MASIQDVLAARIAQDQEAQAQKEQLAAIIGATGTSALGVAAGSIPHHIGNAIRPKAVKESLGILQRGRPGFRMAGGLVGAMVGGGMGAGLAIASRQNPAGDLLAKIQANGEMTPQDQMALETLLAESYNKGPGMM